MQNREDCQLKLQNVNLQGSGLGTECKTTYMFIFIDINKKDVQKSL